MPAITFYFQIHQPYRFRPYTVFDLGVDHMYENADSNRTIMRKVAERCYLPMNTLLLSMIRAWKGEFKVSFSISGTALDQFEAYAPDVLDSFKRLAQTGCVEFIAETYSHSLAFLYSRREFAAQVKQHRERIESLFGARPVTFRNTELIYNNDLARVVEDMGYEVILAEGADHLLGWRSPNYLYQPINCHKLRLLLRNHQLSDDIAFRFSDQGWPGFPLTAERFASWLHSFDAGSDTINLFMDYETFGEHQGEDTGIFAFMEALPGDVLAHPGYTFMTPAEVAHSYQPVAKIDVPQYVSWADVERDLTAWLGNDMQLDAMESLYRLEDQAFQVADTNLLTVWRRLQTSDHFYYMSTKWLSDGDVHTYFNPYSSPYDAYINYMNILADFENTLADAPQRFFEEEDTVTVSAATPTKGAKKKTVPVSESAAPATPKKTRAKAPEKVEAEESAAASTSKTTRKKPVSAEQAETAKSRKSKTAKSATSPEKRAATPVAAATLTERRPDVAVEVIPGH